MSTDKDLESLQSEAAHLDALASLQSELAAAETQLNRLKEPGLSPKSALVAYQRFYERERKKVLLRIDILNLPGEIAERRGLLKLAKSPGARRSYKVRCAKLQCSRLMGRSRETALPPSPEIAAELSLAKALGSLKAQQQKLRELRSHDTEWADLLRATPEPARQISDTPNKGPNGSDSGGRREEIDAFISKLAAAGRMISRKDVWIVASYKNATEFQRFQRGDPRTTNSAAAAFRRVLRMSAEVFVESLEKKLARM